MTYTYGYDPSCQQWIVGPATEAGTISETVQTFATAREAKFYSDRLNNPPIDHKGLNDDLLDVLYAEAAKASDPFEGDADKFREELQRLIDLEVAKESDTKCVKCGKPNSGPFSIQHGLCYNCACSVGNEEEVAS